jgi:hypothetical protein
MLEQLFSRSLSRYTWSAHATDLDAFVAMVAARGLGNRRTERHTRRLLRVLETGALPPNATIGVDALRAAFAAWPHKGYVGTWRLYCRYLQERGRLAVPGPCQPRFALKEQHLRRLVALRGIAPATVTYAHWALTDSFQSRPRARSGAVGDHAANRSTSSSDDAGAACPADVPPQQCRRRPPSLPPLRLRHRRADQAPT